MRKRPPPKKFFRLDESAVPLRLLRLRENLRRRCLALPGSVEEFPWDGAGVYKVRGKIFASTGFDDAGYEVAFKPPEDEREDALSLPFVRVADYVGRYGWVKARLTRAAEIAVVWPWIEASHARLAGRR